MYALCLSLIQQKIEKWIAHKSINLHNNKINKRGMTNKLVLSKSQELLQTSFFFYNAMTHLNNLSLLLKSKMNHYIV